MARRCKTCTSTLRDEIDKQIMQGASFTYLEKWCCDRGLQITTTALRKHANSHIDGYDAQIFAEVKKAPVVDTIAHQLPDPTIVDFDAYLKSIQLDYKEVLKENDTKSHLKSLELSVVENYFRLSAILNQKLIAYEQGQVKFPIEQIKAIRLFFEVYLKVTGIDFYIEHNKAFDFIDKYYGFLVASRDVENNNLLRIREGNKREIIVDMNNKTIESRNLD